MTKKNTESFPNSKTLIKGLSILEAFISDKTDWGIRELADELKLSPTTVYRMIATLDEAGYLEQNPETRRYQLGPKVMKFSTFYKLQHPLPVIAQRVFESYSNRFEHNFYLGTLNHFEVVYLAVLEGQGPLKVVTYPGVTISLHTSALGKVLLAYNSNEFIQEFIKTSGLLPQTPRSISDPETLWKQIHEIRENKFAINDGEDTEDVAAIGVPVFGNRDKVIASISLTYPRHFVINGRIIIEDIIALAQEISSEITLRLGDIPPMGMKR